MGESPTTTAQVIHADLTWVRDGHVDRFVSDRCVVVNEHGRIEAVVPVNEAPPVTSRLEGRALLPGFVNAHSHAFQRGLRGRGENFPAGAGTFWTWREAMYDLVDRMDEALIYELSHQAFSEMLAAGMTSVGEFHYLHHDASGEGHAFDAAVLRAAKAVGIRIVLLNAFYKTGGIGAPLQGGQQRFSTPSVSEYWSQMDRLAEIIDPATQSLGVVAHSIRAVPLDDLKLLHEESERRGLVFHMHVEEQPAEIESCIAAYHQTPMRVLLDTIDINPRFTAVHCTHTAAADMTEFLDAGGQVCLCPLTEANLGDGLADLGLIERHHGSICLGSDSNARISMLEEMRWMEYGQRLSTMSRGVCVDQARECGPRLLASATRSGARALGLSAGDIHAGALADFCAVDLDTPSLAGWDEASLASAITLGVGDVAVCGSCVGGRWFHEEGA